jgi:hypothetical protein
LILPAFLFLSPNLRGLNRNQFGDRRNKPLGRGSQGGGYPHHSFHGSTYRIVFDHFYPGHGDSGSPHGARREVSAVFLFQLRLLPIILSTKPCFFDIYLPKNPGGRGKPDILFLSFSLSSNILATLFTR